MSIIQIHASLINTRTTENVRDSTLSIKTGAPKKNGINYAVITSGLIWQCVKNFNQPKRERKKKLASHIKIRGNSNFPRMDRGIDTFPGARAVYLFFTFAFAFI